MKRIPVQPPFRMSITGDSRNTPKTRAFSGKVRRMLNARLGDGTVSLVELGDMTLGVAIHWLVEGPDSEELL